MPGSRSGLIVRTQTGAGGAPFPPDPLRTRVAGAYLIGQSNQEHVAGAYLIGQSNQEHVAGAYLIVPSMVPGTPILTLVAASADRLSVSTSEFAPPDVMPVMPHYSTHWQLSRNVGFTDLVYDSTETDEELITDYVFDISSEVATLFWIRARHTGQEIYQAEDPEDPPTVIDRDSDWSNILSLNLAQVPAKPTVSFGTITNTSITVQTNAYSDPLARPHLRTEWELQRTNGAPVYVVQTSSTTDLVEILLSGLWNGQTYRARARHVNNINLASPWADWQNTATDIGAPGKPFILDVDEPVEGSFIIVSGEFQSGNIAPGHKAAHWQVSLNDSFSNLVVDTGWTSTYLVEYPTTVFLPDTHYWVRKKDQALDDQESDWSDAFPVIFEKTLFDFFDTPPDHTPEGWELIVHGPDWVPLAGHFRVVQQQGAHHGKSLEMDLETFNSWVPAWISPWDELWQAVPRPEGDPLWIASGRARTRMRLTNFHHQSMIPAGGPIQAGIVLRLQGVDNPASVWFNGSRLQINGPTARISPLVTRQANFPQLIPEGTWVELHVRYWFEYVQSRQAVLPHVGGRLIREDTGQSFTVGAYYTDNLGFPAVEFGLMGQRPEGVKVFNYLSVANRGLPLQPTTPPSPVIRGPYAGQVCPTTSPVLIEWEHPWLTQTSPAIQYEGERWTTEGWAPLFSWRTGLSYSVAASFFIPGPNNKVRVRARIGPTGEPSVWSESQEFTVTVFLDGRGSTNFSQYNHNQEVEMFEEVQGGIWSAFKFPEHSVMPIKNVVNRVSSTQGAIRARKVYEGIGGFIQMKAHSYAVGRELGYWVLNRQDTRPGREHLLGERWEVRFSQDSRTLKVVKRIQAGVSGYLFPEFASVDLRDRFNFGVAAFYHMMVDVEPIVVEEEVVDLMLRAMFWRDDSPRPETWDIELSLSGAVSTTTPTTTGDSLEPGLFAFYGQGGAPSYAYAATRAVGIDTIAWDQRLVPYSEPGNPCLLEATLYKEDREEIDWQVTDSLTHLGESGDARPYMIQPFNYGEQILDFIRGSATISQVSFSIIDFISNLTGQYHIDKQYGWLTTKLSETLDNFRSAIQGRRLRLRRFISELEGWITIGDGPASAPQMESYSQYQLTIRDSREWERKLPISQSPQLAVFPPGPLEPWGDGMVAASPIITGFFEVDEEIYGPDAGYFYVGSGHWISGVPSSPSSWFVPKYLIYGEAQASVNAPELIDGVLRYSKVMIRWRYNGDTDEQWRYVRNIETANGYASWPLFGFSEGRYTHPEHGTQTVQAVRNAWATFRQDGGYEVPLHDIGSTSIQFQVLYVGHTNELFPLLIDGLTLGEFIRDVYDGKYSPTDPQGNIVPTGIRYNEEEVLKLTQPIRARLTAPIDDARAWLESNGYAVVGYTPAFDHDLLIAPLSDRVPSTAEELAALTIIDETITEPSPTWAHGDRVINVLQFTYPRFFIDEESQAVDGLGRTEITISRQNLQSSFRNGVKVVQLSTELFASLGEDASTPLEEVDYAEILAEDRRLNLFNRYRFGTPAFQINVFRIATFHMRAGQFARFSLSWFPDYYKQSRSMDVIGHIIAIADLDCNLRRFTVEVVAPWPDDAS